MQVLQRDCACREVVRRVQASRLALGKPARSANTSAYCQARAKLEIGTLRQAHEALVDRLEAKSKEEAKCRDRTVKLIDGTGFSMPDSEKNRAIYPYAGGQKPGCDFLVGKLVAIFSLAGHLVRLAHQSWKTHEIGLARMLVGWINPGDVLVADRGFCGWGVVALLLRKKVDVIWRSVELTPSDMTPFFRAPVFPSIWMFPARPPWNRCIRCCCAARRGFRRCRARC